MVAHLQPILKLEELNFQKLKKFVDIETDLPTRIEYDQEFDALYFFFIEERRRYIAQPILSKRNKWISLLFDPDTREVIGMQVAGFEKSFIQEFPEVKKAWQKVGGAQGITKKNSNMDDTHHFQNSPKPIIAQAVKHIAEEVVCV